MQEITSNQYASIQAELHPGETILWIGRPETTKTFHKEDFFIIPFSLFWCGFTIVWEAGVSGIGPFGKQGAVGFMQLWGIPFLVIGQYLVWGRFIFAAYQKRRTIYGVTNKRVIAVQRVFGQKMVSVFLESLPTVIKDINSDGTGTLQFTDSQSGVFFYFGTNRNSNSRNQAMSPYSLGDIPKFMDIAGVDSVYHLVLDAREKLKSVVR